MKTLARLLIVFAFALSFSASAGTYDLSGLWTLKVENRRHKVVTTLTVKFTNQSARTCVSGDWSQVAIVSASTQDQDFYPVSGPLSFNIENDRLTIERNDICDAYSTLSGTLNDKAIKGKYFSDGLIRHKSLGFFTLDRAN